jgi:hypothetical protein
VLSNFVGQMVAAITFAVGTAFTAYGGTAVLGGCAGADRRSHASGDGRLAQDFAAAAYSLTGSSTVCRVISGSCDMVKRIASGVKPQTLNATQKSVEKLRQMISLTAAIVRK